MSGRSGRRTDVAIASYRPIRKAETADCIIPNNKGERGDDGDDDNDDNAR